MQKDDRRPLIDIRAGGRGVSVHRDLGDKHPHMHDSPGGRGVSVQRGSIPYIPDHVAGRGINAHMVGLPGDIGTGDRLIPMMRALAQRLARVIVLARDWESALTPTVLMDTRTSAKPSGGSFLRPSIPGGHPKQSALCV